MGGLVHGWPSSPEYLCTGLRLRAPVGWVLFVCLSLWACLFVCPLPGRGVYRVIFIMCDHGSQLTMQPNRPPRRVWWLVGWWAGAVTARACVDVTCRHGRVGVLYVPQPTMHGTPIHTRLSVSFLPSLLCSRRSVGRPQPATDRRRSSENCSEAQKETNKL